MLPTNVVQALVIAVAILVGFTLPITAPQVLWVKMVTSVALGLVISSSARTGHDEPPPRAVDRPILTGFGLWRIAFVGLALLAVTLGAFFWMKQQGASMPSPARSWSGRRFSTYTPPLQATFGTEAIPLRIWPWLLLGGLAFFLVVEVEKLVIRSSARLRRAVADVEAGVASA